MSRHSFKDGSTIGVELSGRQPADHDQLQDDSAAKTTEDDAKLLQLGKRPVLKVASAPGVIEMVTSELTLAIHLLRKKIPQSNSHSGGTAGLFWGFLICWIGTLSTFVTLSELASMAPLSGGQYHWVSLLAPPSSKRFLSYITGWITVLGWQAQLVADLYLTATIIRGTAALTSQSYKPTAWQAVLILWAILAVVVTINVVTSRALAYLESVILFIHILGFFGLLIPLVYLAPHKSGSVFTSLFNGGGWSSVELSFIVGLPSMVFALLGADSAIHMSEEIQNAAVIVPRAIVSSLMINGGLGLGMAVALIVCLGSFNAALNAAEKLGYAYLEIFAQAVRSNGGAAAMSSVICFVGGCACIGALASAARLLWSFARDDGLPFSRIISKVNTYSTLPLNATLITMAITMLLSLIALGSSIALNDILSLTVASLYSSYLITSGLLLYRRCKGQIQKAVETSDITSFEATCVTGFENLQWGPWRVPEPFGTINNAFACVYLTWILFWSFWPPFAHVTALTMNFSIVVFGATVIFSVLWYIFKAHRTFKGPIVEFSSSM